MGGVATVPKVEVEGLPEALHLYRIGQLEDAEACCRAIVEHHPRCGEAWERLARIAERHGRPEQAETLYRRAIAMLRDPAEAHHNLAVLLQRRVSLDEALDHYRAAVALGLHHALLHSNLGCLLRDLGHLQEGVDHLSRALEIDDSSAHAHSNLGVTLTLQGRIDRALPHLRRAVDLQPTWDLAHSNLLFCLNYADDLSPARVAAHHLTFGRHHIEPDGAAPPADPDPDRKLRVGFVSPDLKQHSVAYFLEPLLGAYDRDAFEIICYADVIVGDSVTDRMRGAVDRWRPIRGVTDAGVARLIRVDRIDILIDLAGHTANNRMSLFATRVAPVQMTYLGYCNTTGLETVDWRITDAWADPPGMTEALHSEQLLRLSHGFLCFQPRADAPAPQPPPVQASGRITFGSFNLQSKISPTVMALWAAILDRVPDSRLYIKGPGAIDPATRALFERSLASSPLEGHDVTLLDRLPDERDHLATYGRIDVALDTWPYGGTTTTCEALWMGVPVVTLTGPRHASRVGASLLSRVGAPELVADTPEAYVAAAVALAGDRDRLAALRGSLRGRMISSGITDAPMFARDFGEALRRAWRLRCEQARAHERPAPPDTTLARLAGDLRVVVSDTPGQLTPSALAQRYDGRQDEVAFVRAVLARGQRALDIGADHGVYALTMARRVGFSGRVWAFEPDSIIAARLRASVAVNALPQATVVEAALGRAHPHTLDACHARLGISDIAFVKIKAQGPDGDARAEIEIIEGGRAFFTDESPLVMFDLLPSAASNRALLKHLHRLGYRGYRLIPGLGILAPLADSGRPDAAHAGDDDLPPIDLYTLNLFACKDDRAAALEERGLLARAPAPTEGSPGPGSLPDGTLRTDAVTWRAFLRAQLFAAPLWPRWSTFLTTTPPAPVDQAYARCLDQYALAHRITGAAAERHAALAAALQLIVACASERATLPILQTLARITSEAGERAIALQALSLIDERCASAHDDDLDRPFLPVSTRFDDIPPDENPGDGIRWVAAGVAEQRERLRRRAP